MVMELVTVSSKGQIAIPKHVRDTLNLMDGTKLTLEVRGQEIVLSKGDGWKALEGAGSDKPIDMAEYKRRERELEDRKSQAHK
jgi:AbrB family looped-hinge helix DNA binding protein